MERMGDKYTCKAYERRYEMSEHENSTDNLKIKMSELYTNSMCSLGRTKVRNYLKCFSHTSVQIKETLPCLKQKSEKKCKLHQDLKPYNRSQNCNKHSESRSSVSPCSLLSQRKFDSLEENSKKQVKKLGHHLKVMNPNGTITEVTLKPVLLMHVNNIPVDLGSKMDSQTVSKSTDFESHHLRADYENQSHNHSDINILRVKSSHNTTDLLSERNMSCMKVNRDILTTQENFEKPNCQRCQGDANCSTSMVRLVDSSCSQVYYIQNSVFDCDACQESFFQLFDENKVVKEASSNVNSVHEHPDINCSIHTIFRRPHLQAYKAGVRHFQDKKSKQYLVEEKSHKTN